jgi:hypothetical protein
MDRMRKETCQAVLQLKALQSLDRQQYSKDRQEPLTMTGNGYHEVMGK